MPYIPKSARYELAEISDRYAETPGELNYVLTCAIANYVEDKGLTYQTINDVLGALDGAGREFYRRVAAPYEDEKIVQNGDVYDEEEDVECLLCG